MNKTVLLILAGGFCTAFLAAVGVQMMFPSKPAPESEVVQAVEEVIQNRMTQLLVADHKIAKGDVLDAKDFRWIDWPVDAVFNGAVTRDAGIEDADTLALEGRLRRDVLEGEPLTQSLVLNEKKGNFVAAALDKGMRAVALTVNATSSVGGFVMPGDHVDVIMTYEVRLPSDEDFRQAAQNVIGRSAAETVLRNVRVLAIDQSVESKEDVKLPRTVTVAVDREGAETLALAASMGDLSLALRRFGEVDDVDDQANEPKVTTDRRISQVMQELFSEKNKAGMEPRIVRVYNGSQVDSMAVKPASYGGL